MTNNAPVYWEVQKQDGTWFSLHTYSWSVKSFGGRRWLAGPKRGEDLIIPFQRGRVYMPKSREAQNYDINMWVFPTNEDGTRDPTKTIEQKKEENWRKIVAAVDQEGQFRLRKRWFRDDSTASQYGTQAGVSSAVALAEFLDGSGPDSDDGHGFYMNLTFTLADPYFYSNDINSTWTAAQKAAAGTTISGTTSVTLEGEAPTDHVWLSISGAGSSDPKITFPDGNWIQLKTSKMSSPNSEVVIDCHNGIARVTSLANYLANTVPSSSAYVNGLISRSPNFPNWPSLDPNRYPTANITATGSGTIKLVYDPAYR